MDNKASKRAGILVTQQTGPEGFKAFVPNPLPPEPPLQYDGQMNYWVEKANRALGRLDGLSYAIPNPELFLYMFVRKEAVLSSQIEGTQASLADLLEFEGQGENDPGSADVEEVSNYVKAIDYGLKRLDTLPLSNRLIKEIHSILLQGTRGWNKSPGEFRHSQNWIGGTMPGNARFVPPPCNELDPCMNDLEKFIHDENTPTLVKAGLAHAQFETIHPFLDGNGRMGRLLITLILCNDKVLEKPLLYLSLFFKKHREEYYERLNAIRRGGDWEGWIKFYLQGVFETSTQATTAAKQIMDLQTKHQQLIAGTGRAAGTGSRLLALLYQHPHVTVQFVSQKLLLSAPSSRSAIQNFERLGILREVTGKRRDRHYRYEDYLAIIQEGTELDKE